MADVKELWAYIAALVGVFIGVYGWLRSSKGDAAEQAKWMGEINERLKNINEKLDDLKGIPARVQSLEDKTNTLEKKLEDHIRRGINAE